MPFNNVPYIILSACIYVPFVRHVVIHDAERSETNEENGISFPSFSAEVRLYDVTRSEIKRRYNAGVRDIFRIRGWSATAWGMKVVEMRSVNNTTDPKGEKCINLLFKV